MSTILETLSSLTMVLIPVVLPYYSTLISSFPDSHSYNTDCKPVTYLFTHIVYREALQFDKKKKNIMLGISTRHSFCQTHPTAEALHLRCFLNLHLLITHLLYSLKFISLLTITHLHHFGDVVTNSMEFASF